MRRKGMQEIARLRKRIDDVDRRLVRLLAQRYRIAAKIGKLKPAAERGALCQDRVREILATRGNWAVQDGMERRSAERVFRLLVNIAMKIERRAGEAPPAGGRSSLGGVPSYGCAYPVALSPIQARRP